MDEDIVLLEQRSSESVIPIHNSFQQPFLSIQGPYNHCTWFVIGFSVNRLEFINLRNTIERLFAICRAGSNINTRFSMRLERGRSIEAELIKNRLWDIIPGKLARYIYNLLYNSESCYVGTERERPVLKMIVHRQESAVKYMSVGKIMKKRSVITIDECMEVSLVCAFYVAIRRNAIIREKNSTRDPKCRKELENKLTNVYRKGLCLSCSKRVRVIH